MARLLKRLWKSEKGAVATEYVILIGTVALVLVGLAIALRGELDRIWNLIVTALQTIV